MEENTFLDRAIHLLEQIDSSSEKREWCRRYSVYAYDSGQEALQDELYRFFDRSYREGLVISNDKEAIQRWGLEDRQIAAADDTWLAEQSYLCVLAGIAWHFRRDHFSQGSLIGNSVANGILLKLFRQLKLLCPASSPATTFETLCTCKCSNIPEKAGVYWVLAPKGLPIHFTEQSCNPTAPCYPPEVLLRKYMVCSDKEILYIGKADGRNGLRRRVQQYMNYGRRGAKNHKGGRAVWQIQDAGLLLLAYEACDNAREREKQLLAEYKRKNGAYPVANWRG